MTTLLPMDDDRVLGIRVDGKITEDEFDRIVERVEDKLSRMNKIRIYIEIIDFGGLELKAFFEDLKMGLRHWDRFEREAVVSDAEWVAKLAPLVARLFPMIEVKVFPTVDEAAAREWVSGD